MAVEMKLDEEAALKDFRRLEANVMNKIVRPAVGKAMVPVNKTAKALVDKDSLTLQKSIAILRPKTYKATGVVISVVGPRAGFMRVVDGKERRPSKYAHLVEYGTVNKAAKPFLRPALKSNVDNIRNILITEIGKGITKELAKS